MELNVFTTNVTLQDIPTYTTNITLEGQLLKLSFFWNERLGLRTLSVVNGVDECYLQNTTLHPNEPFELNSNAVFNDLPYSVILQKVGDVKKVGNIYNWSKDFILCFYRTIDVEKERLNIKYGVVTSTPSSPEPTPPPVDAFCEGAIASATVGICTSGGILEYFVNGSSLGSYLGREVYGGRFESSGLRVVPIKSDGSVETQEPDYEDTRYQLFENLTSETIRVKVKTVDANEINQELVPINPTTLFSSEDGVAMVEFCLLPKV